MDQNPQQQFLHHTVDVWQPYYPQPLHQEEAQEIIHNLTQFIDLLCQWDQAFPEKRSSKRSP